MLKAFNLAPFYIFLILRGKTLRSYHLNRKKGHWLTHIKFKQAGRKATSTHSPLVPMLQLGAFHMK